MRAATGAVIAGARASMRGPPTVRSPGSVGTDPEPAYPLTRRSAAVSAAIGVLYIRATRQRLSQFPIEGGTSRALPRGSV